MLKKYVTGYNMEVIIDANITAQRILLKQKHF